MAKHKFEMIRWVDSHSPSAQIWIDPREVPTNQLGVVSVGAVLKETKKNLTIVSSICDGNHGQVSGVITIPKCAIKSRKRLK